ncbi:phosphate acyltransferase PlsX [Glaciecola petra]|uniref:phosphate acyltransferase PlsX n=1 Tax=Glaciecola petra TaxID=3075602 RepID=UPI003D76D641
MEHVAETSADINIAIDIMGGDRGPHVFLYAVENILQKHPKVNLTLCGDDKSKKLFASCLANNRVKYEVCEQIVNMSDKPTMAIRSKKQSSMRKALELTKCKEVDACVSSGNTGALMATAYYVLKTLPGITRPALATLLPTQNNSRVLLLDLGASISYDAESLYQYALMGSILMQECQLVEQPRVALLNVGEEEIKGHSLVKHADLLIRSSDTINYIGYVEGDDIFAGKSDVVVTDGFTGNVALKASEGIASFLSNEIKTVCTQSFFSRVLSKLAMPLFKSLYQRMNPDQYNGASLLGLRSIVVKSHGNASPEACYFAVEQAIMEVKQSVPTKIKAKIEQELMEH